MDCFPTKYTNRNQCFQTFRELNITDQTWLCSWCYCYSTQALSPHFVLFNGTQKITLTCSLLLPGQNKNQETVTLTCTKHFLWRLKIRQWVHEKFESYYWSIKKCICMNSYFKQLHNQSEYVLGKEKIFMKRLYVNEMWL